MSEKLCPWPVTRFVEGEVNTDGMKPRYLDERPCGEPIQSPLRVCRKHAPMVKALIPYKQAKNED